MNKKIKVINNVFYNNCVAYSKLCIAKNFNKNCGPLYANHLYPYSHRKLTKFIAPYIEIKNIKDDDSIFNDELGVEVINISNSDCISKQIINHLNQGDLVLQWIDNYYFPEYSKSYHTKHTKHGFLIYDYDIEKMNFKIIDAWGFNANRDLKTTIGMKYLEECIVSSNTNLPEYPALTIAYKNRGKQPQIDYKDRYLYNYKSNFDEINQGLLLLPEVMENFLLYAVRGFTDKQVQADVSKSYIQMIRKKESQQLGLQHIFNSNEINNTIAQIVALHNTAYDTYHKMLLKSQSKTMFEVKSKDLVADIISKEQQLQEMILNQ